jgi:hypothetical protein
VVRVLPRNWFQDLFSNGSKLSNAETSNVLKSDEEPEKVTKSPGALGGGLTPSMNAMSDENSPSPVELAGIAASLLTPWVAVISSLISAPDEASAAGDAAPMVGAKSLDASSSVHAPDEAGSDESAHAAGLPYPEAIVAPAANAAAKRQVRP